MMRKYNWTAMVALAGIWTWTTFAAAGDEGSKPADAAPQVVEKAAASRPAVRPRTAAEKLTKTAHEWRALAAKKKAAAAAETDPEKKKLLMDSADKIEKFAHLTAKQADDEMVFAKDPRVLEARLAEKRATRDLAVAQEALDRARDNIHALGVSTDLQTKAKAAEFEARMKDYQDKSTVLEAAHQKRLKIESAALSKAASSKKP